MSNRTNLILAMSIWTMFALSTADWSIALALMIARLKEQDDARINVWFDMTHAVVELNVHKLKYRPYNQLLTPCIVRTLLPMQYSCGEYG